jgi:hypothetical protein
MSSFPLHSSQQFFGLICFMLAFCFYSWKQLKTPLSILMLYCLWSAIDLALNPFGGELSWVPPGLDEKTMYAATQTALMIVLMVSVSLRTPRFVFRLALGGWVIATVIRMWMVNIGFENGYSFTSAALICAMPIVYSFLWPFIIVTALKFAGATTIGCLGIVILSLYWKTWWKYKWYCIPLGIASVVAIDHYLSGGGLRSSNGRMEAWGAFIDVWWEHMPHWLGTGYGSWEWIGPFTNNPTNQAFQWVHNDFLQMMFEGGLLGLICLVYATAWVIGQVWKDRYTRSAALGFLVCMMTYYPLHFVSTLLLAIYICKVAISKESAEDLYRLPKIVRRKHR